MIELYHFHVSNHLCSVLLGDVISVGSTELVVHVADVDDVENVSSL